MPALDRRIIVRHSAHTFDQFGGYVVRYRSEIADARSQVSWP